MLLPRPSRQNALYYEDGDVAFKNRGESEKIRGLLTIQRSRGRRPSYFSKNRLKDGGKPLAKQSQVVDHNTKKWVKRYSKRIPHEQ